MNHEIDIIIPLGEEHIQIASQTIVWLRRHYPHNRVYIISSRASFDVIKSTVPTNIKYIDEDGVMERLTIQAIRTYFQERIKNDERAPWYFQQFLKMSISSLEYISNDYLIWDADCIMLRPLTFIDDQGKTIFTKSKEYHAPYFESLRSLLGMEKQVNFSFISEHMLINKGHMQRMIESISSSGNHRGNWVKTILESIDDKNLNGAGFSEYETYGNYMTNYFSDQITFRELNKMRDGTVFLGVNPKRFDLWLLSFLYCYVSFERWQDRGLVRFVRARLLLSVLEKRFHFSQLIPYVTHLLSPLNRSSKLEMETETAMSKLLGLAHTYLKQDCVKVILDVGARDLKESIMLSSQFPSSKIFAFECNPQTLPSCYQKAGENDNITLIDKAVNEYDGFCKFYPIDPVRTQTTWNDGNPGASSLFKANGAYPIETYVQNEIEVECVRIDTVLKAYGVGKVDVVWMDLQGAELLALKGMGDYLKGVDIIVTEVEANPIYEGQCLDKDVISFLEKDFELIENGGESEWGRDIIFINKKLLTK